jgi:serine/threonine protein kinase
LNDDGYISLVDFGISKQLGPSTSMSQRGQRTFSVRGTPEYMAPEMLSTEEGHSFPVDWWALGTLSYEMLVGQPPFFEEDQSAMFKRIKKDTLLDFPVPLSEACRHFIAGLLCKNPEERLGSKNGFIELMNHPFLEEIDFEMLEKKAIPAPYRPQLSPGNPFDVSFFDEALTQITKMEDPRISGAIRQSLFV